MDQRYLEQLILYIHLNPVAAGVVEDPSDYPWSGHLELMGSRNGGPVDVDETLLNFGKRRATARKAYSKRLAASLGAEWTLEDPGELPWWRRMGKGTDDMEPRKGCRSRRSAVARCRGWEPTRVKIRAMAERRDRHPFPAPFRHPFGTLSAPFRHPFGTLSAPFRHPFGTLSGTLSAPFHELIALPVLQQHREIAIPVTNLARRCVAGLQLLDFLIESLYVLT